MGEIELFVRHGIKNLVRCKATTRWFVRHGTTNIVRHRAKKRMAAFVMV